jgi:hypothetical protein
MSEKAVPESAQEPDSLVRNQWKLVQAVGKTAAIWSEYGLYCAADDVKGEFKQFVVCKHCRQELSQSSSSSTTSMHNHFKRCQTEQYREQKKQEMAHTPGAMEKFLMHAPGFQRALAQWLVMDQQALSAPESPYFRRMIACANPKAEVPDRRDSDDLLLETEIQVKAAIGKLLPGCYMAITTNGWTSVSNESYCSLTVHYICHSGQLVAVDLGCYPFPGPHTGDRVAAQLHEVLAEYNIDVQHVVGCVTDTAANIKRAARFMRFDWYGCMAHQLELVTGLFFNGVGVAAAMQSARSLVGTIKSSPQLALALRATLEFLNQQVLAIIQDVITRWWSTYSMLVRLLQLRDALETMFKRGSLEKQLTSQEWEIVQQGALLLEPFMLVQRST